MYCFSSPCRDSPQTFFRMFCYLNQFHLNALSGSGPGVAKKLFKAKVDKVNPKKVYRNLDTEK